MLGIYQRLQNGRNTWSNYRKQRWIKWAIIVLCSISGLWKPKGWRLLWCCFLSMICSFQLVVYLLFAILPSQSHSALLPEQINHQIYTDTFSHTFNLTGSKHLLCYLTSCSVMGLLDSTLKSISLLIIICSQCC